MPNVSNWPAPRARASVQPYPDHRHVRIRARVGLNAATSTAWRRPGGQPYVSFGGAIHEGDARTTRRLRRLTSDAADAALYWDDER